MPDNHRNSSTINQRITQSVAEAIAPVGGFLRCETCRREQGLGDVASHLASGWPKCCGLTMTWVTQRQVDSGEQLPQGEPE